MRQIKKAISLLLLAVLILFSTLPAYATTKYKYDPLGRLTEATYSSGQKVTYTYDTMGNMTTVVSTATQAKLTKIEFVSAPLQLKTGEASELVLKAQYSDETFKPIESGALFTSSNELIITVDETGKATAKSEGEATITATYNGFTATAKITVIATQTELAPVITTAAGALARGMAGADYTVTIEADHFPTAFAVSSGSLPEGLSIGNDGVISGKLATAGTSNFSIAASNKTGTSAPVEFHARRSGQCGGNFARGDACFIGNNQQALLILFWQSRKEFNSEICVANFPP